MAKPPYVPDWVDDRTAEWCADLCDAMAARIAAYTVRGGSSGYIGAEVCAISIRSLIEARRRERQRSTFARLHSTPALIGPEDNWR
jgi:hypothetical protein